MLDLSNSTNRSVSRARTDLVVMNDVKLPAVERGSMPASADIKQDTGDALKGMAGMAAAIISPFALATNPDIVKHAASHFEGLKLPKKNSQDALLKGAKKWDERLTEELQLHAQQSVMSRFNARDFQPKRQIESAGLESRNSQNKS